MNLDVATLSQASAYIPFLNWQYIYCWIVSLFGYVCTETGLVIPKVAVPTVTDVTTAASTTAGAVGEAGAGFWSWLWPFGHGGASAGSVAGAGDAGFWASIVSVLPEPVLSFFHAVWSVLSFLWNVFSWLSYTVSGVLFVALSAALLMLVLLRIKEWSEYGTLPPRPQGHARGWRRWQELLDGAMAPEPKRWKEAIVAADDMLGELLTRLSYFGETTAEQLRHVPEAAFVTLPQAWEAHRIKNFVVQRSSNFILTQREAFRVMKLYEQVFEEFDFI